jgi:hypothetical protein
MRGMRLEHFHYYYDVVGFAMCGHSFTPARKDRAPGTPIRWNGRARFSFYAYTNSENALGRIFDRQNPVCYKL